MGWDILGVDLIPSYKMTHLLKNGVSVSNVILETDLRVEKQLVGIVIELGEFPKERDGWDQRRTLFFVN